MRLSEAIRLGALLAPQGFDYALDKHGRTCALGAASQAVGVTLTPCQIVASEIVERWPFLADAVRDPAPASDEPLLSPMRNVIESLNDDRGWTREQIADWVETVEPRSTETATAPVADSAEILSPVTR